MPGFLGAGVINEGRLWKLEKGSKACFRVGGEQCTIVCNGLLEEMLLACEPFVINSTRDEKCCAYENATLSV